MLHVAAASPKDSAGSGAARADSATIARAIAVRGDGVHDRCVDGMDTAAAMGSATTGRWEVIYMIRDGHITLGVGRTVDEAVREACRINIQLGLMPRDAYDMKRMIDVGVLKVREICSGD